MSEAVLAGQPIEDPAVLDSGRARPDRRSLVDRSERGVVHTRDAEARSEVSRAFALEIGDDSPDRRDETALPESPAAAGAPVPRVDVEFAHRCAAPSDVDRTHQEIEQSTACARALIAQLTEHRIDAVSSVLVDDKKNVTAAMGTRRQSAVLDSVHRLEADRVMLESELERHLPAFSASLPESSPLPGRFERRRRQHGELACSQDVAIWHSLRLGLFKPAGGNALWAANALSLPPVEVCVVVLPNRFQAYEEKAYLENFRHLKDWHLDRRTDRTILRGRYQGRSVRLWAVWVDVDRPVSELRNLGSTQAGELAEALASDRVPATIG